MDKIRCSASKTCPKFGPENQPTMLRVRPGSNRKPDQALTAENLQIDDTSKDKAMVVCKLYVWPKTKCSKGHVSLSLGTGDYISWWPNRKWYHIGIKFDVKIHKTFEDDVKAEYGAYPEEYPMEMPLENVLKTVKWWKRTRGSVSDRQYSLTHCNCCTIVMEALKILVPKGLIKTVVLSLLLYLVLTPSIVKWTVMKFVLAPNEPAKTSMGKQCCVYGKPAHASAKTKLTKKLGGVLETVKSVATVFVLVIKYLSIQLTGFWWLWVNRRTDDLI